MRPGTRRSFVFDALDELSRLRTVSHVSTTLTKAMTNFGFTTLGINGLPPRGPDADPAILTESAPAGFRDLYVRERLYLSDHICVHARTARQAFRYSEAPYEKARSRSHERFLQVLQSFGMGHGLIVPLGEGSHHPACVWLAGESPDLDDDTLLATQMIASFAASKAYVLSRNIDRIVSPLTTRERDVLAWSAQGKSAWEIGTILGIAKRTVDEHARVAARKLGATNRTQAVAIAISRGIIEL
jgi:LuxR family quorum sensing-dependent transcriptional regulator